MSLSAEILDGLIKQDEGLVSSRIFTDSEIYRLELERIFTRTWLYVAHETEIPRPGDFVSRSMEGDPVIVSRGRDGKVRVFLNVCRYRGRKIRGEDLGNTLKFICGYHTRREVSLTQSKRKSSPRISIPCGCGSIS